MAYPFTDRIRYRQTPSGFRSPSPNVTDTEEMSPLKLVPARRRAQDARGHEADRPRAGDPLLPVQSLIKVGKQYAGNLDLKSPLVSPVYGNMDNLGVIEIGRASCRERV